MASSSTTTLSSVLEIFQTCLSRGEWCKIYAEVCNGQEFVTFSVQKPLEDTIVAGSEKKKSQGQKRRERRKRMKEKRNRENEEKELAKAQEAICLEEVSTDASDSDDNEVFAESLETNPADPRSRLRLRSRKLVLSVGEAVTRPSENSNEQIEQLDGVTEADEAEDGMKDEGEATDEEDPIGFNMLIISIQSADLGWKESKAVSSATFDSIKNNIESNIRDIKCFTRIRREDSENTFSAFLTLKSVIHREELENVLSSWHGFTVCRWEGNYIT